MPSPLMSPPPYGGSIRFTLDPSPRLPRLASDNLLCALHRFLETLDRASATLAILPAPSPSAQRLQLALLAIQHVFRPLPARVADAGDAAFSKDKTTNLIGVLEQLSAAVEAAVESPDGKHKDSCSSSVALGVQGFLRVLGREAGEEEEEGRVEVRTDLLDHGLARCLAPLGAYVGFEDEHGRWLNDDINTLFLGGTPTHIHDRVLARIGPFVSPLATPRSSPPRAPHSNLAALAN